MIGVRFGSIVALETFALAVTITDDGRIWVGYAATSALESVDPSSGVATTHSLTIGGTTTVISSKNFMPSFDAFSTPGSPADHVIRPREAFQRSLAAAARAAALEPSIFVFGIHPSFPATSFGWIRAGAVEDIVDGIAVHVVERFVEKPDLPRARQFLEQGGHYWNSGMFVASVAGLGRAFGEHLPQVWSALEAPLAPAELAQVYARLPSVSLDVGVLEREPRVRMLPIDYFWSDVGSWDALSTVHAPDESGNLAAGGAQVVASDSTGNIVHGEDGALVALVGVDDLIVVHSGSITLVCRRDRAQDVKSIVERLRSQGPQFL
ncbi:MAG: mannose-1-phosphate guanylyltransferase [Planctomycetaceae bacterium]|nr:mannose-1-phosphate guanylyltransferase [Planctomycetaceae bacterium]